MNEDTVVTGVKKGATLFLILGILTVILGAISMCAPFMTGIAITIVIGSLLLISGLLQIFHGFRVLGTGSKIFAILVGVLTMVAGGLVVARPLFALGTLTLILAGFFIAEGILTIIVAMKSREHSGWGWFLFNGLVSLVLGILIWRQWPLSGMWAIGILVGIRILMCGLGMVFVGSATRYVAGHMEPETIEG